MQSAPLCGILNNTAECKCPVVELLSLLSPHNTLPLIIGLRELPGQSSLVLPLPLETKLQLCRLTQDRGGRHCGVKRVQVVEDLGQ